MKGYSYCPRCGRKHQPRCVCGMLYYDYGGNNYYWYFKFDTCLVHWYPYEGHCQLTATRNASQVPHSIPYVPYTTTQEDLAKYLILI